jgi:CubicO group peptidase (beta-lactamase class C family)
VGTTHRGTETRRRFLIDNGRAVLGLSVFAQAACSTSPQPTGGPDHGSLAPTLIADLEKQVPSLMKSARVPGMAIAILANGRLAWSRSFGVTNMASKASVTVDTLFNAASISKTVFAYAVMKLCERGLLDLDKALTTYTAERWVKDDPRFDQITARHVLSHTSGLQNWSSKGDPLRIHFAPGSQWLYSGEGYSYLQSIVSRLTGHDIDSYMRANIFEPFGMTSSGYIWNDAYADRYAAPHDGSGNLVPQSHPTATEAARYGSAGGLFTTANQYARFLAEVINPGPADAVRLTGASRDEMVRPQVRVDEGSSWALGWRIVHGKGGDLITHGGENVGFQNFIAASIQRRAGYVILSNGDNGIEIIGKLTNGATPLNGLVSGA